jgi:hypothetical protein
VGTAARLFGVPVLVAAVALTVIGSRAFQPSGAQSERATKLHSTRAAKPRGQRPKSHPSPDGGSHTIAGAWDVANGIFEFQRTGAANTFTDVVIRQRPGVFCPRTNDQNGQMVLHHALGRVYTGTWAWYYVDTCKFAGYGPLSVRLWWDGHRATFVAGPPTGLPGSSYTFLIDRVK